MFVGNKRTLRLIVLHALLDHSFGLALALSMWVLVLLALIP